MPISPRFLITSIIVGSFVAGVADFTIAWAQSPQQHPLPQIAKPPSPPPPKQPIPLVVTKPPVLPKNTVQEVIKPVNKPAIGGTQQPTNMVPDKKPTELKPVETITPPSEANKNPIPLVAPPAPGNQRPVMLSAPPPSSPGTKSVTFDHPKYGKLEITPEQLDLYNKLPPSLQATMPDPQSGRAIAPWALKFALQHGYWWNPAQGITRPGMIQASPVTSPGMLQAAPAAPPGKFQGSFDPTMAPGAGPGAQINATQQAIIAGGGSCDAACEKAGAQAQQQLARQKSTEYQEYVNYCQLTGDGAANPGDTTCQQLKAACATADGTIPDPSHLSNQCVILLAAFSAQQVAGFNQYCAANPNDPICQQYLAACNVDPNSQTNQGSTDCVAGLRFFQIEVQDPPLVAQFNQYCRSHQNDPTCQMALQFCTNDPASPVCSGATLNLSAAAYCAWQEAGSTPPPPNPIWLLGDICHSSQELADEAHAEQQAQNWQFYQYCQSLTPSQIQDIVNAENQQLQDAHNAVIAAHTPGDHKKDTPSTAALDYGSASPADIQCVQAISFCQGVGSNAAICQGNPATADYGLAQVCYYDYGQIIATFNNPGPAELAQLTKYLPAACLSPTSSP
jgi:hypothetical protein